MTKIGRYNLSEISLSRIMLALKVRLSEIPHSIAWRSSPVAQENREKIRTFNNLHQNQRCFIVANGPSLAKTDLQLLEDEITFGLNRIYLYFDKTSFRPSYYLSVNELVLEQYWSEISTLQMPKFLNWNRRGYFDPHDRNIMFVKSKMVINDFFQYDLTRPLVIGGTVH